LESARLGKFFSLEQDRLLSSNDICSGEVGEDGRSTLVNFERVRFIQLFELVGCILICPHDSAGNVTWEGQWIGGRCRDVMRIEGERLMDAGDRARVRSFVPTIHRDGDCREVHGLTDYTRG
jgi:hypothetical protein